MNMVLNGYSTKAREKVESKEIVIDIINKYFGECCDEGGGTTGYVLYPHSKVDDIVQDLYKVNELIQQQKAENEKLKRTAKENTKPRAMQDSWDKR